MYISFLYISSDRMHYILMIFITIFVVICVEYFECFCEHFIIDSRSNILIICVYFSGLVDILLLIVNNLPFLNFDKAIFNSYEPINLV